MNDSFIECANLFAAGNTRPSMEGNRSDGKVCNAKPGECRAIGPHYSGNMRDNQSWTLPVAGNHCFSHCCSLVHPEGNKEETVNSLQHSIAGSEDSTQICPKCGRNSAVLIGGSGEDNKMCTYCD